MKSAAMTSAATLFVTGLMLAFPAYSADPSALPAEKSQGNVRYVSGGVGLDQSEAFKQAAARYPLELLFAQKATPNDQYLAKVRVTIRDHANKTVLNVTSDGPFLLAQLPAGKYQIEADYEGAQKRQAVEIQSGKHSRVVLLWDATDAPKRANR